MVSRKVFLIVCSYLQPASRGSGRLCQIVGNSPTSFSDAERNSFCARFIGEKAVSLVLLETIMGRNSSSKARILLQFPTRICRHGLLSHPPCRPRGDVLQLTCRCSSHRLQPQRAPQLMRQFSCATKTRDCVRTTTCCSPKFHGFVGYTTTQWWSFSSSNHPRTAALCSRISRG